MDAATFSTAAHTRLATSNVTRPETATQDATVMQTIKVAATASDPVRLNGFIGLSLGFVASTDCGTWDNAAATEGDGDANHDRIDDNADVGV